jgi:hypothetical protein
VEYGGQCVKVSLYRDVGDVYRHKVGLWQREKSMGILRRESIPSDKGVEMKVAAFSIFLLNNIIISPWIGRLGHGGELVFYFYPSVGIVILRGLLGRCITQSTGNNPLITHGKGQPTAQPTHTHTNPISSLLVRYHHQPTNHPSSTTTTINHHPFLSPPLRPSLSPPCDSIHRIIGTTSSSPSTNQPPPPPRSFQTRLSPLVHTPSEKRVSRVVLPSAVARHC